MQTQMLKCLLCIFGKFILISKEFWKLFLKKYKKQYQCLKIWWYQHFGDHWISAIIGECKIQAIIQRNPNPAFTYLNFALFYLTWLLKNSQVTPFAKIDLICFSFSSVKKDHKTLKKSCKALKNLLIIWFFFARMK